MPTYKYTVAQLKEICDVREIDYSGCTLKKELIALLQQNDQQNDEASDMDEYDDNIDDNNDVERANDDDDDEYDEVRMNEGSRRGDDDDDTVYDSASSEPESLAALRLKLALVRAERDKELALINAKRELNERSWQIEQERVRI